MPRSVAIGQRTRRAAPVHRRSKFDCRTVISAIIAKHETGEMADVLRLAQRIIDVAEGDPTKGTSSSVRRSHSPSCCGASRGGALA